MTKRTAIVLFLTTCIILAAGIYFYRASRQPQRSQIGTAGPPPDLMSLLPNNAPAVFYVDAAALRGAPFVSQAIAMAPAVQQDADYRLFVAQTGFDYTKDLDHVAGAVWPGGRIPQFVAIAEGRFDQHRIEAYARSRGSASLSGTTTVYTVKLQNSGNTLEMAFLSPTRLALAQRMGLASILNPQVSQPDPQMAGHLRGVAGSALFAVARAAELRKATAQATSGAAQLNQILAQVEFLSFVAQPKGENLDLALEADCATAADSLRLSTLLEGLRWMGRATLADRATRRRMGEGYALSADSLLRAAVVTHQLRSTAIHLVLTPEMLQAAMRKPATARQ